jgi:solute:Na+ symporter, SSS family
MLAKIAARFPGEDYIWSNMGSAAANPMGVLDRNRVRRRADWRVRLLDYRLPRGAAGDGGARPALGAAFKMVVPFVVILPGLLGRAVLPMKLMGETQALATGGHSYIEVMPLIMARYLGPGLLGLGVTALIAGFMAGNVSAFTEFFAGARDMPQLEAF